MINEIIQGSALERLKELDSESVDCCITSPPYWSLRDYKTEEQLGLEPTFNEYINKLIQIFNEVKRVLKKEGSCWVNMGDTYNGTKTGNTNGTQRGNPFMDRPVYAEGIKNDSRKQKVSSISEKSLCLIPQRFQIAMVDVGWVARNTIIWYKPNCMPSSAKDRFTVDFEYLFFFVKNQKYYFDTQYEPHESTEEKYNSSKMKWLTSDQGKYNNESGAWHEFGESKPFINPQNPLGRIKRCIWKIPTAPFADAHFAVFPPELVETPIKACSKPNDLILDPFIGSGTVALVALQNARNFIGIELNPEYIKMAYERLDPYLKQQRITEFGQA